MLRSIAQTPSVLTRTGASGRKPFAPYARRLAPEVVTKDVANAVLTGYLDNMSRPIDVSCKHLGEATYRFNTRDEKDGQRFADVVSRVAGKRLTWKELTA